MNARDERLTQEASFNRGEVMGNEQFTPGGKFDTNCDIKQYLVMFESTTGTMNQTAVAEYPMSMSQHKNADE